MISKSDEAMLEEIRGEINRMIEGQRAITKNETKPTFELLVANVLLQSLTLLETNLISLGTFIQGSRAGLEMWWIIQRITNPTEREAFNHSDSKPVPKIDSVRFQGFEFEGGRVFYPERIIDIYFGGSSRTVTAATRECDYCGTIARVLENGKLEPHGVGYCLRKALAAIAEIQYP